MAESPEASQSDMRLAGHIASIQLINFMCHENLCVDLNPDVNFIVGRNGSGKSALFAGLILGLGGSAKLTGRAGSLDQFVKTGCNSAKIRLEICNEGEGAMPDYDDRIVIERNISNKGVSTYSVFNGSTRLRDRSNAKEVARIAGHFGCQVDNPFVLMSQDMARQFLQVCVAVTHCWLRVLNTALVSRHRPK